MRGLFICLLTLGLMGCPGSSQSNTTATSGVKKANVKIQTDKDGHSIEQNNIIARLKMDNKPGSIKHLYIISAMSGDVILYSTVRGKVTSSSKRLTPTTVAAGMGVDKGAMTPRLYYGANVNMGGKSYVTPEIIQDDGTYGSSISYLYWWDSAGKYHQHYVSGGQIIHVSDQPIAVKKVILNLEQD